MDADSNTKIASAPERIASQYETRSQSRAASLGAPKVEGDVLTVDITQLAQSLLKGLILRRRARVCEV
jgi:hypothetical protein